MERLANEVLARNGVTSPPVDVDLIAEREGLHFEAVPLTQISGAYYPNAGGRSTAYINAEEHRLRQVFTKAHELCHHLLDERRETHAAGYPNLQLPSGYRGRETHWLHDRFAAALLMPRSWIGDFVRQRGWRLERDDMIAAVARNFGVSPRAAGVRLEILGHIERRAP